MHKTAPMPTPISRRMPSKSPFPYAPDIFQTRVPLIVVWKTITNAAMAIIASQLPYPSRPSLERTTGTVTNDVQVDRILDRPSNPLLMNSCLRILVKSENSAEFETAGTLLMMGCGISGSRERLCNLDAAGAAQLITWGSDNVRSGSTRSMSSHLKMYFGSPGSGRHR